MNAKQLGKLWTALCGFLLYYAMDSWLVTQGGKGIFGAHLVSEDRVPVAMLAIPICSVLLMVGALVGRDYARMIDGTDWAARIPVVGFESLDMSKTDARIFQAAVIFAFTVLPIGALIHFWLTFNAAKVISNTEPPRPIKSIWDWSGLSSIGDPARACTSLSDSGKCLGNATIFPGLEPWIFVALTGAAVVYVFLYWSTLARGAR
jgi:hypothetical protein